MSLAVVAAGAAPRIAHAQVIPDFPPPYAIDPFESGARAPAELHAADAFARGASLSAAGRAHEAALAFEESYAALPRSSTLYNIGQAYRAANEPMRAIAAYRRYLASAPMSSARRHAVATMVRELERRVATVSIVTRPASASLTLDGHAAAPGAPIAIEPGRHTLSVRAAGHVPLDDVFRVREGEHRDLVLALDHRPLATQWWFWTLVGAAATSVALTTTAIVLAMPHEPASCGTLNVCTAPR
jgi:tetratricopeptide (TPR) repeat protein